MVPPVWHWTRWHSDYLQRSFQGNKTEEFWKFICIKVQGSGNIRVVLKSQGSHQGLEIQQLLEFHYSHLVQVDLWDLVVQGGPVPKEKKGIKSGTGLSANSKGSTMRTTKCTAKFWLLSFLSFITYVLKLSLYTQMYVANRSSKRQLVL